MCYTFLERILKVPAVHVGKPIIVEPTSISREPKLSFRFGVKERAPT